MNAKVFFIAFAFLCLAYTIEAGVVCRSADDNITTPATINITSTTTEDNVQNKVGENKPENNDQSKKDQEATTKAADAAEATTGAAASNPEGQDKIDTTTAKYSTLTEEQLKEKEKAVGGLVALWWLLNLLKGGQ